MPLQLLLIEIRQVGWITEKPGNYDTFPQTVGQPVQLDNSTNCIGQLVKFDKLAGLPRNPETTTHSLQLLVNWSTGEIRQIGWITEKPGNNDTFPPTVGQLVNWSTGEIRQIGWITEKPGNYNTFPPTVGQPVQLDNSTNCIGQLVKFDKLAGLPRNPETTTHSLQLLVNWSTGQLVNW
ncbi:hypothetical protein MHU86_8666 [Fragilaria crotonensis]|nr:hypothetical protein MHU86_8666 [Fragilaria crotonensis]